MRHPTLDFLVRERALTGPLGGIEITHTPARHWGARVIRDVHRGFGGFVLRSGRHSLYHAGDTAYFPGFSEIGARLLVAAHKLGLADKICVMEEGLTRTFE